MCVHSLNCVNTHAGQPTCGGCRSTAGLLVVAQAIRVRPPLTTLHPVTQLEEYAPPKRGVAGSSPARVTACKHGGKCNQLISGRCSVRL